MDLSILKNRKGSVLASLLILLVGCESPTEPTNIDPATVTVTMERIPNIELNDYSWQTIKTVDGNLSSDDVDVENFRVEWSSDMYWSVHDTAGYFKLNCRTCRDGVWYGSDGTTEEMILDLDIMAPVTNYVSITDENGDFRNVIAPVRSMVGKSMWLWWEINCVMIDSQSIYLME
ncbi:MAG: hypothetical protein VX036_01300 [Pseudomonadota bacterium]|nr:hypothetical protein [Pseudomonadota bacterium]